MKAWQIQQLGDPWDELKLVELQSPSPGAGGIRIRVEATDLNFADILQCQGGYQVKLEPPFTPGMNAAGTVVEAGRDCHFAVGDRVVGPTLDTHGGYAEGAVLVDGLSHAVPDGVSLQAAAAIHVTHGTGWFALHQRGNLQPAETVLVLAAAGGVGSAALQMAKAHGCYVIAAAGGAEKTALCTEWGADLVIDYNSQDLYEEVMRATDKRGVDVIYDPVGGKYFDVARRLVAWEGRLLVVGFASGTIPQAPANHALMKNYSIVGVHMGGYRQQPNREPLTRCYNELHQQLLDGTLAPLISDHVAFGELPEALQRLANRQTTARLVFDPSL